MKITIDEATCLKHKLTFNEAIMVLAIKFNQDNLCKTTLRNLVNRGVINFEQRNGNYYVAQHWDDIMETILYSKEDNDKRLMQLAERVQECFPKQKMKDRFGRETPFYYRCNKSEIKKKLEKFLERYGEVSDEDIIDATKRYVASFRGNYSGMRLAKYFIWKDDRKLGDDEQLHVEALSDLATFLENKDNGQGAGDDWMMNSKN